MKKGITSENSIYNLTELVVKYKTIKGEINQTIDKKIEKFANESGLKFIGSGYNYNTKTRDLQFKSVFE